MSIADIPSDPKAAAKAAGLRYIDDRMPGITRKLRGRTFIFFSPDGKTISDPDEIARIRSLAIPPAYEDVWISPIRNGHLQATGRDARGRKQYRYHKRWREVRDESKFGRMLEFGRALPKIRAAVERDLALPGLPRAKVLATVVQLLETTLIRVGNEEYAKTNKSFGLTTMRDRHVDVKGETLRFHFRGKSGIEHNVDIRDRRMAKIVARLHDLPGQELFQYVDDDGTRHGIDSQDVNDYLHEIAGGDFTAKDFRTLVGTVFCALALAAYEKTSSQKETKQNLVDAIKRVAERLGNTPAVCRKAYIHPAIVDEYLSSGALKMVERRVAKEMREKHALTGDEARVLRYVEQLTSRDEGAHVKKLLERSVKRAKKSHS